MSLDDEMNEIEPSRSPYTDKLKLKTYRYKSEKYPDIAFRYESDEICYAVVQVLKKIESGEIKL